MLCRPEAAVVEDDTLPATRIEVLRFSPPFEIMMTRPPLQGFHGVAHLSPFLRRQTEEGLEMVSPGHVRLRSGGRATGHRAAFAETTSVRMSTH